MKNKLFQASIVFVVCFITFSYAKNKRPNILFVMADQLAPQFLPCYGHPVVKAPRLLQLARQVRDDLMGGVQHQDGRLVETVPDPLLGRRVRSRVVPVDPDDLEP